MDAVGPKLTDVEAVDDNFKDIVDIIDSLREKADTNLDEYTGVVKRISPGVEQVRLWGKKRLGAIAHRPQGTSTTGTRGPSSSHHIQKPQRLFEHKPHNYETGGFRPFLSSKPHATVSLAQSTKAFTDNNDQEQYDTDIHVAFNS